jgi:hypothetical protein
MSAFRTAIASLLATLLLALPALAQDNPETSTGVVRIKQVQIAVIGSGALDVVIAVNRPARTSEAVPAMAAVCQEVAVCNFICRCDKAKPMTAGRQ